MNTVDSTSGPLLWTGRVLTALVVLFLAIDGLVNLFAPQVLAVPMQETGFPVERARAIGILLLVCTALYAIRSTCMIGAILITGFLGGAICTHFRIGGFGSPPQIVSLVLGVAAWGGLYLRFPAVRRLRVLTRDAEPA